MIEMVTVTHYSNRTVANQRIKSFALFKLNLSFKTLVLSWAKINMGLQNKPDCAIGQNQFVLQDGVLYFSGLL